MHAYFALSMVKYLTESSNINDFTKTFEQTSQHLTYFWQPGIKQIERKQSVIANKYRNCEQEAYELLFCIIAYNTLSRLESSDDVSDDENAKENLVKVSGNPILPMGYRKNVNLHTYTVL